MCVLHGYSVLHRSQISPIRLYLMLNASEGLLKSIGRGFCSP